MSTTNLLRLRLLLTALLVAAIVQASCSDEPDPVPFTSESWLESPKGSDERYAMAKDLVSRKALTGLTIAEVEYTLGPGNYSDTTMRMAYALGGPIQPVSFGNTLIVEFSDNGIVVGSFIYRE